MTQADAHPRNEAVLDAWAAGVTGTLIAASLNITVSVVSNVVYRARQRGDERAAVRPELPKAEKLPRERKPRPKPVAPELKPTPLDEIKAERARINSTSFRSGGGLPFEKMKRFGQCKWPIGDPKEADFVFCAVALEPNEGPYCCAHHQLSIGRGTPSERSAIRVAEKVAA